MGLRLKDWYSLTKVNRVVMPASCFLLGVFAFSTFNELYVLPIFTILFLYAASATLNDLSDIDIDKISNPDRPLPARKLTRLDTFKISIFFAIVGVISSYFIGIIFNKPYFVLFGAGWLMLGIIYAVITSHHFITSSFTLSLSHGLLPFLASLYLSNSAMISYKALVFMGVILSTLFMTYNVKDFKDMEGDRLSGRVTIPLLKDASFGKKVMLILFIMTFPTAIIAWILLDGSYLSLVGSVFFSLILIYSGVDLFKANSRKEFSRIITRCTYVRALFILSFLL